MDLTLGFDEPFYFAGSSTSDLVPSRFPVAINSHAYLVDLTSDANGLRGMYFRCSSIPVLRAQADQGNTPSESSINPNDLWRRSIESWKSGAGQSRYDRKSSDGTRFRSSKGIDVWTDDWQISLLHDTSLAHSSANTNCRVISVGSYAYFIDGQTLQYSTNMTSGSPTFTTVTGTPAQAATSITTDGFNVYVAYGTGGIYTTTRGAAAATQLITTSLDTAAVVGYVKGRLMVGNLNSLYNITSATPGALPTALMAHPNSDWRWTGFAEGPTSLYASGFSGSHSAVYRTQVVSDASTLNAPVVAGEAPDGEIVRSIQGYEGMMVLGSDLGVRLCSIDSAGSLTLGGLVPTSSAVQALSPSSRFVWFGWSNYDNTSTGMGRVNLSVFTDTLVPAYASDLMATGQGAVLSIAQVAGKQVFSVSGLGFYVPSANLVASGTIDSGLINYDLADTKIAMYCALRTLPLQGSVTLSLSVDSTAFVALGTFATPGQTKPTSQFSANQSAGENFEIRLTLTRDAVTTNGPTVTRVTLRAQPTPARSFEWVLPLIIHERLDPYGIRDEVMVVDDEVAFLKGLLSQGALVTLQIAAQSYNVLLTDVEQLPFQQTQDGKTYDATVVVRALQPSTD